MALLDAKCTNCGAALKIDGAFETACCAFCGAQLDVGNAVRYHFTSLQPPGIPPATPKNHAASALFCGLASCAIGLFAGLLGLTSLDLFYYFDDVVLFLTVVCGILGVFMGIVGIVRSIIARREEARTSGNASAGSISSLLGLIISSVVTVIYFVMYLDAV